MYASGAMAAIENNSWIGASASLFAMKNASTCAVMASMMRVSGPICFGVAVTPSEAGGMVIGSAGPITGAEVLSLFIIGIIGDGCCGVNDIVTSPSGCGINVDCMVFPLLASRVLLVVLGMKDGEAPSGRKPAFCCHSDFGRSLDRWVRIVRNEGSNCTWNCGDTIAVSRLSTSATDRACSGDGPKYKPTLALSFHLF